MVYSQYRDSVILKIEKIQKQRELEDKPEVKWLIIFDDCLGRKQKYSEVLEQIFLQGRHKGISIIFAHQHAASIPSSWRENTDLTFLYKPHAGLSFEHSIKSILSGTINMEQYPNMTEKYVYSQLIQTVCQDHRALVIDYNCSEGESPFYHYRLDEKDVFDDTQDS
jgi:hypothetical protein